MPVPELNRQITLEHEGKVIRVGVRVPDELALNLDYHDIVAVEGGNDLRRPVIGELFSFVSRLTAGMISSFHYGFSFGTLALPLAKTWSAIISGSVMSSMSCAAASTTGSGSQGPT